MMMFSKMSNLVTRVFGRGLLIQGRYAMASDRKTTAIHHKYLKIWVRIFETNNWKDFMSLFQQEKEEFTPDVIATTTKHIISLLNRNKGTDHQEITKII